MLWNFNPKGLSVFVLVQQWLSSLGCDWNECQDLWGGKIKQLDKVHGFCYILYHVISFRPCGKLITIKQKRFTCFKGRSQIGDVIFTCFFVLKSNWKQHPKTTWTTEGPPHNLKPNNAPNGFLSKPPHPNPGGVSHGVLTFSTQEKDYVFQPGPAEAIGMCLTEDGVLSGKSFWDGGGLCQHKLSKRFLVCKKNIVLCKNFLGR